MKKLCRVVKFKSSVIYEKYSLSQYYRIRLWYNNFFMRNKVSGHWRRDETFVRKRFSENKEGR